MSWITHLTIMVIEVRVMIFVLVDFFIVFVLIEIALCSNWAQLEPSA